MGGLLRNALDVRPHEVPLSAQGVADTGLDGLGQNFSFDPQSEKKAGAPAIDHGNQALVAGLLCQVESGRRFVGLLTGHPLCSGAMTRSRGARLARFAVGFLESWCIAVRA